MIEIFKEFTFEAAHQLGANVTPGHPYANIHGHSFKATVYLRGTPDPDTGWICDLGAVEAALTPIRADLDHRYLNDIPGLERPTLEVIAAWIAARLKPDFPGLHRVTVGRASCGEGCTVYL